jgi:CubicO group peptidase (beta-lactamase class C family)
LGIRARRVWLRFAAALLAAALLAGASFAGVPRAAAADAPAGDGAETEAKLAALFTKYDTLGACVCVFENGAITHTYCYGLLAPAGAPVTGDTLFRVGSISKMIAGMGVMRLVDDGLASLDSDLSAMLGVTARNPQYPDTPITLRQLMSHTAGFRDGGLYTQALRGEAATLTELFSDRLAGFLFINNAQAGTQASYSNFGGGLLGSVIENLTGQTVDDYMTEAIFAPLGITAAFRSTRLPETATVSDMFNMPSGTLNTAVRVEGEAPSAPDPQRDYTLTAGKLTISAPDLAMLLIALCDGGVCGDARVLSETSCAAMRALQNGVGSVTCDSGYGLSMNILTDTLVSGRTLYGHGGKANGMLCEAYFDPTDRTGVVMLTNGCDNQPATDGVGTLGVLTIRLCYAEWIDGSHVTQDPWLVED